MNETETASKTVVEGLTLFERKHDYHSFCQLLGWQEDDWSRAKWRVFKELTHNLSQFDIQILAKLVDAGGK